MVLFNNLFKLIQNSFMKYFCRSGVGLHQGFQVLYLCLNVRLPNFTMISFILHGYYTLDPPYFYRF